jgi:DNA-binding IclR family transcriptional regulator
MSEAARKALRLIEAVARSAGDGLGSTALADAAGVDKTTVSRLMSTLVDEGWVSRDPSSRRYFPGRCLWEIAYATTSSARVLPAIDQVMAALQASTGETIALHRLVGYSRLCIASHESPQEVRASIQPGLTAPLHQGASSYAILAFAGEVMRREVLADLPDEATREALRALLDQVAERGYVYFDTPRQGGSALAVPIFAGDHVYGSLTVVGPSSRFTLARAEETIAPLSEAARNVGRVMRDRAPFHEGWAADRSR